MSDAVAMVAGYAFFFAVYMPFVVAYISGGFEKFAAYFMTPNEFADDA
jgi:hypothetical protein